MKHAALTRVCLIYLSLMVLAITLLLAHIGGILPGLLLMGLVMGGVHLSSIWHHDEDEPPVDPDL